MAKSDFLSFLTGNKLYCSSWAIVFVLSFFIFFTHGISYLDPDFGWHVRVGQDVANSGQAPRIETYTFPTLGQHWIDHEWLSNLLLYLVFVQSEYGYWILSGFFATLITSSFLIIILFYHSYFVFVKKGNVWSVLFFGAPLLIFNTYAVLSAFGVRLQTLSWFFTTILLSLLFFIYQKKKQWLMLLLPALMFLWANTHGTFVLGVFFLLMFIFILVLFTKESSQTKVLFLVSGIASVLVTFITPYKIDLWRLIIGEYTQNRGYLLQIQEWLPMYAAPHISWYSAFFVAFFVILFIFGIVSKQLPKTKWFLIYYVFVFLMLMMSVQARRFLPFFALSSFPISLFILVKLFSNIKIKKWVALPICVIAIFLIFDKISYIKTVPVDLFEQNISSSPYKAVTFLKSHPALHGLNIYNQYGWGGYLDWMWPEKRIFIDGRMPQRPLANGNTFLEEYFELRQEDIMKRKLKEYDIKLILIPTQRSRKQTNGLEKHLLENFFMVDLENFNKKKPFYSFLENEWQEIYSDEVALVYLHPSVEFGK